MHFLLYRAFLDNCTRIGKHDSIFLSVYFFNMQFVSCPSILISSLYPPYTVCFIFSSSILFKLLVSNNFLGNRLFLDNTCQSKCYIRFSFISRSYEGCVWNYWLCSPFSFTIYLPIYWYDTYF